MGHPIYWKLNSYFLGNLYAIHQNIRVSFRSNSERTFWFPGSSVESWARSLVRTSWFGSLFPNAGSICSGSKNISDMALSNLHIGGKEGVCRIEFVELKHLDFNCDGHAKKLLHSKSSLPGFLKSRKVW